jgi:LPXTG-motif cell wall-anchored protein
VTTPQEDVQPTQEVPVPEQAPAPQQSLRQVQETQIVVAPKKVTICHRTASYTNPYVEITVDVNAADGIAGNSGNEADHYGEHKGPLFNSNLPKHVEWGDIIPAIPGVHAGQNLANGGQAILDAGCTVPVELEVEASDCVIGESTTGSLTIWVYGSANGNKVTVTKGGDDVVTFNNVNENTAMPLTVTGLGAGEYVVSVTKGKDTLASEKVTLSTCPPIEVTLPEPTVNDPCGPRNATWVVPANTSKYTWQLNEKGELIVTTVPPYVFAEGETTYNYGTPKDENKPCPIEVTPVIPSVMDICYTDKDGIYVKYTEGVVYKVNGEEVSGWVDFTGTTLHVTAETVKGYVFPEGATVSWTFDSSSFTNKQCLTITKTAKVASDTNLDGKIGVGDKVTWEITVTNTSDESYEAFYVLVDDANTVLENDGYIGYLGEGQNKTLTATSTITANDLTACKVTNVATFYGWRAQLDLRSSVQYDEEEIVDPLATGTASATYKLDCPEPGRGEVLGTTTTTTTTSPPKATIAATSQVLPATLPATGASDDSNIYLILGLVFSGFTYFAMMRRYQEA